MTRVFRFALVGRITPPYIRLLNPLFILTAAIITAMPILTCAQTHAPINWKDRYVTLAEGDQTNVVIARPSIKNYTVVVWEDYRNGDPEIYAQKIDNTDGLPRWYPIDGVKVVEGEKQYKPVATYDTLGGVYIAWENHENASPSVWLQRLEITDGSRSWDDAGINLCDEPSYEPAIIGDQLGAYIAFTDARGNSKDITLVYIDNGSNPWTMGQRTIADSTLDEYQPVITTDGVYASSGGEMHMGVYVAWLMDDNAQTPIVFGRHVYHDSLVCLKLPLSVSGPCSRPRIAETGPVPGDEDSYDFPPAGAVITWAEWNGYLKVMAQNLDWIPYFAGTPYFRIPGVQYGPAITIGDYDYDQQYQTHDCWPDPAASDPGSGYYYCYLAWEDQRNSGPGGATDIYMNYFDVLTGTIFSPQGEQGIAVTDLNSSQTEPDLEISGDGIVTIAWTDYRTMDATDIYTQQYEAGTHTEEWQTDGWPVTRAIGNQTKPQFGKNVFTYQDGRRSDVNIYSQTFMDSWDDEFGPSKMEWRGVYASQDTALSAEEFNVVVDSSDHIYTVWTSTDGDENLQVFVQKFDINGVPLWKNGGIPVGNPACNNSNPDICVAHYGGAYVTWKADSIRFCHIDEDGNKTANYALPYSGNYPAIVEDGDDHAYIAYTTGNVVVYKVFKDGTMTNQNIPTMYNSVGGPKIGRTINGFCVAATKDEYSPLIQALEYPIPGTVYTTSIYSRYGFDLSIGATTQTPQIIGSNGGNGNLRVISGFATIDLNQENAYGYVPLGNTLSICSGGAVGAYGGYDIALVAWCSIDPNADPPSYQIRCNGITYDGQATTFWEQASAKIMTAVDSLLNEPTPTDIIFANDGLKAYVVWMGNGYSQGSAIKVQLVDFTVQQPDYPGVWQEPGNFVTGYPLGFLQANPQIRKTSTGAICFFQDQTFTWSDNHWLLNGASIDNYSSTMRWRKESPEWNSVVANDYDLASPYPMPYSLQNNSTLTIPVNGIFATDYDVVIYNLLGKEVYQRRFSLENGNSELRINAHDLRLSLEPGVHLVSVSSPQGIRTKPIVVTK